MSNEILRADLRLRRTTLIVLVIAILIAAAIVFAFRHWLGGLAAALPTEQLVVYLRRWTGAAALACSACILVLAGHAARQARRALAERRWPLQKARVVRDTAVRHGEVATCIGHLLNITAMVLVVAGVATALLGWRLLAL